MTKELQSHKIVFYLKTIKSYTIQDYNATFPSLQLLYYSIAVTLVDLPTRA